MLEFVSIGKQTRRIMEMYRSTYARELQISFSKLTAVQTIHMSCVGRWPEM